MQNDLVAFLMAGTQDSSALIQKVMFFLHNSASASCSNEHKRIYLIEGLADALYLAENGFVSLG